MKTVEITRGTFEGKYHAGDQVAVPDLVADMLVKEKFAKVVESGEEPDASDYVFASVEEIQAMSTKKELETYAASIGMLSLDSRLKVKDMQNEILNYQEELIAKSEDESAEIHEEEADLSQTEASEDE